VDSPPPTGQLISNTRRRARVVSLQVLYEVDEGSHDAATSLASRLREDALSPQAEAFARRLIEGVLTHQADIDATITAHAPAWPVSQMALVERNILRLAIFEMTRGGETPLKVAINEAVELGKAFGGDSSPKLVNGVLGSVMESAAVNAGSS